jgi:hypothetical protein
MRGKSFREALAKDIRSAPNVDLVPGRIWNFVPSRGFVYARNPATLHQRDPAPRQALPG